MKNRLQLPQGQRYKSSGNKLIITTVFMAVLISGAANATETSLRLQTKEHQQVQNENIGFGTGAIIGAIAAGPIGAFVTGLGGVFIAKFINVNDDNEKLNNTLLKAKQKLNSSEKLQRQYHKNLQRIETSYQKKLVMLESKKNQTSQLQTGNLLMSLQFSTGSSDIAPHYQEQIAALAQILNNSPKMKVELSGYTDLTGESLLNKTLSQERVDSVKALLIAQGVDEHKIAIFAFGEDSPVVANTEHEVSFYDRRVVLKLYNYVVKK